MFLSFLICSRLTTLTNFNNSKNRPGSRAGAMGCFPHAGLEPSTNAAVADVFSLSAFVGRMVRAGLSRRNKVEAELTLPNFPRKLRSWQRNLSRP